MKKFRTLFHVEQQTENTMTIKQWGDNYEKWLEELNFNDFYKWIMEIEDEKRSAILTLFQFIKSLSA